MVSTVDIMLYRHFYSLGESKQEGTAFLYGRIKEQLSSFHLGWHKPQQRRDRELNSFQHNEKTTCASVDPC